LYPYNGSQIQVLNCGYSPVSDCIRLFPAVSGHFCIWSPLSVEILALCIRLYPGDMHKWKFEPSVRVQKNFPSKFPVSGTRLYPAVPVHGLYPKLPACFQFTTLYLRVFVSGYSRNQDYRRLFPVQVCTRTEWSGYKLCTRTAYQIW
jgi:hypothetical protein